MHRAPSAALAELCGLETAQGSGGGSKEYYTAATEAETEQRLTEFSLKWDAKFPHHCKVLAQQLGASDSVLRAPAGDSEGDLHDQRD